MQTTSLRVYLAAHAPVEPQFWFKPIMAERLEDDNKFAWQVEYEKRKALQWPLAWADEQIKLIGDRIDLVYFKMENEK